MTEYVTLAGGCFWCTEAVFKDVIGVETVESGYIGGHAAYRSFFWVSGLCILLHRLQPASAPRSCRTGVPAADPPDREVGGGGAGHAEAIRVTFDPATISYDEILDIF